MHRKLWFVPLVAVLAAMLAFAAACGDDDDNGDNGGAATSQATTARTPSGGATSQATTAGTPAGGATSATTPGAGGGGAQVEIAAENSNEFTESELTADAGSVTIVFHNNEDGVIHNCAIYDDEDSAENLIDATDLTPGPSTNEITVDLEAGAYHYNCQVHPNMSGTLTAQ
jgi:plastocyanin